MFPPKLLRARGDIIHITHRLSAVQLADTFAMFDNGSVDKYRTHKELYKKVAYTPQCSTSKLTFTVLKNQVITNTTNRTPIYAHQKHR